MLVEMLVATNVPASGLGEGMGTLLPIGGVAGAIAVIVVALIKARSSDRETVIRSQQQHMDRLTRERNDAVSDRDEAYDANDKLRESREQERAARIEAESQLRLALENTEQMQRRVQDLTDEVAALSAEVAQLRDAVAAGAAPPGGSSA